MRPRAHEITGPFTLGDLEITTVQLPHGRFETTGFVFSQNGRRLLAYYTDCNAVPHAAIEAARDVEVLVIDALRHSPHPTHLSVQGAIEAGRTMGAKHTYFTHVCHDLGHATTEAELPDGVHMAYDGLRLPSHDTTPAGIALSVRAPRERLGRQRVARGRGDGCAL